MPVILADQVGRDQEDHSSKSAQQIVFETLSQQNPSQIKGWWSDSGVGPEFKPQDHKRENQ
jgi:hypothetical protein